jgi:surface antigen
VLACGSRKESRRSLYSRTGASRLCWPAGRLVNAALIAIAFSTAGCSYQLETMFSKSEAEAEPTGSVARAGVPGEASNAAAWSEVDLAYARAAAADAITRGGKDSSIPWANPNTGAGGNITPLAAVHADGAFTCRDFLASYAHGEQQSWLQGEACRSGHGKWEVKSLKPLKQG